MLLLHTSIALTVFACFTASATTWQKHGIRVHCSERIALTIEGALSVVKTIGMCSMGT